MCLLTAIADARGHYTIGKEMVDSVIDRIRRVAGKSQIVPYERSLTNDTQTTAPPCKAS